MYDLRPNKNKANPFVVRAVWKTKCLTCWEHMHYQFMKMQRQMPIFDDTDFMVPLHIFEYRCPHTEGHPKIFGSYYVNEGGSTTTT